MLIRELRPTDVPICTHINNEAVPAVSEADEARMAWLLGMSTIALVAEVDGEVAGFCINLGPGAAYDSVNYRWFAERYDDFVYLDRIAVAPAHRNLGIGAAFYAEVEARGAGAPWLLCEVNLRPRNDGSLRFHHRLGFVEVGQQETPYGSLVSMLAKALRAAG